MASARCSDTLAAALSRPLKCRDLREPCAGADLNCHCIDPHKDFVLNPVAWSQPAAGQYGVGNPFYNDYRYERTPSEQMSLGRIFRMRKT